MKWRSEMKSILHIGNVAGVPQELSRAQRKMGLKSHVLFFYRHPYGHKIDLYYPTKLPFPLRYVKEMYHLLRVSNEYDVFHFHFHFQYYSILPSGVDVLIWKALGKKVIIHHHGLDIRYRGELRMYTKFADKIFVSTPDLLEWSPTAIWIPNPIDLEKFTYVGVENKSESEKINIVHAPSNRMIKGTEHIIRAINKLKKEDYKINFILVENMPYNKAIEIYKEADIVIDWINLKFGIYGLVSIENMALGKPVICSIKQNLINKYFEGLPIFNTEPSNLAGNLRILIEDNDLRKELGEKGRRYVEQMHDADKVVKKVSELYF